MNSRDEGPRGKTDFVFGVIHLDRRRFRCFDPRPRKILEKHACLRHAYAKNSVTKYRDAYFGFARGQLHAVRKFLDFLNAANVLPALSEQSNRSHQSTKREPQQFSRYF